MCVERAGDAGLVTGLRAEAEAMGENSNGSFFARVGIRMGTSPSLANDVNESEDRRARKTSEDPAE